MVLNFLTFNIFLFNISAIFCKFQATITLPLAGGFSVLTHSWTTKKDVKENTSQYSLTPCK